MRRFIVVLTAVLVGLVLAGSAFSAKPKPYQGQAGGVQSEVAGSATETTKGTLPFTGQELTLVAVGGVVLVACGAGFYRLSRRRS